MSTWLYYDTENLNFVTVQVRCGSCQEVVSIHKMDTSLEGAPFDILLETNHECAEEGKAKN